MINEAGLKILKDSEGFYNKSYICPAGKWTIGYGTTVYPNGVKVSKNEYCTIDQAEKWLNYELEHKSVTIMNWLAKNKLTLNTNQFSALLCFAYNLGCGAIIDNDRSLSQALLSGKNIRYAFMMYVKAKKKKFGITYSVTLNGLVKRRKLEADLFFS